MISKYLLNAISLELAIAFIFNIFQYTKLLVHGSAYIIKLNIFSLFYNLE